MINKKEDLICGKVLDIPKGMCYSSTTSWRGFFFCTRFCNSEGGRAPQGSKHIPKKQEAPKVRVKVVLACTECKQRNYNTKKEKKNTPDRLEMQKYCRFCRKHTLHRETR